LRISLFRTTTNRNSTSSNGTDLEIGRALFPLRSLFTQRPCIEWIPLTVLGAAKEVLNLDFNKNTQPAIRLSLLWLHDLTSLYSSLSLFSPSERRDLFKSSPDISLFLLRIDSILLTNSTHQLSDSTVLSLSIECQALGISKLCSATSNTLQKTNGNANVSIREFLFGNESSISCELNDEEEQEEQSSSYAAASIQFSLSISSSSTAQFTLVGQVPLDNFRTQLRDQCVRTLSLSLSLPSNHPSSSSLTGEIHASVHWLHDVNEIV
jgi:hypothetical protein